MADPEVLYERLASGDAGAVRERGRLLGKVGTAVDAATDAVHGAADIPVWTGEGASAFQLRTALVAQGAVNGRAMLGLARDTLDHVASAYDDACVAARQVIGFWRNRPAGVEGVLENLLRALVCARLAAIMQAYDAQLAAGAAVLTGDADGLDLDDLDAETRAWVQRGVDRTEDWLDDHGSTVGPAIPNTKATGDDRDLVPQGLGYDPASGLLLQSYYDHSDPPGPSVLSVIDPRTGREVNEVVLAPSRDEPDTPLGHAGGVAVDGDHVYVTSAGKLYTYSMTDVAGAREGHPVAPVADPMDVPGGSYAAVKGGKLYVGDFHGDRLHVYERGAGGSWVPSSPASYVTPPNVQGVVVRDDGFIYSTSEGRTNASTVVVQPGHADYDADTASSYDFPNMSEGIVEVDGQLVATYESGASAYQHPIRSLLDKLLGRNTDDDIWASPAMTQTPLGSLGLSPDGLSGEIEAEPRSLTKTAAALGDPAADLKKAAATLDEVTLPAHLLGEVPSAGELGTAVRGVVEDVADNVQVASAAVANLAAAVEVAAHHYTATDSHASDALGSLRGRLG